MNKTTSINLGGYFFHIDEDAYNKLSSYLQAVKRSLSPEGRDEIIKDIESRIAELAQEKLGTSKQVISLTDVDAIISIMGQPEDYKIDDNEPTKSNYQSTPDFTYYTSKKLYRDKENALLGGVIAGLSHYFGVEAIWLRIIFILSMFLSFGTTVVVYILLWILLPEAITTSQKLEMKGQPITISNIEKKVKEGFNEITDKINNLDHQKIADNAKYGAQKIGSTAGEIISEIFKGIGKAVGFFIVLFATVAFLGVIVSSVILLFSSSLPEVLLQDNIHTPFNFDVPLWAQGLLFLSTFGIPLFFFVLLGLKLLIPNTRSIGNYAKFTLLAIWIFSLISLTIVGIRYATELSHDGKVVKKELLPITANDTLEVKFVNNEFFSKNVEHRTDLRITQDSTKNEIIYSNNVNLHLKTTDKKQPFVIVERTAEGRNFDEANARAEKIKYNYKFIGNQLVLDNFFTTEASSKFRNQQVHVYLYLPEGMTYFPNKNVEHYLNGNNSDFDYFYGPEGYKYKVNNGELDCLNCPPDENKDVEIETVSGEVLGNENVIKTTTIKDSIEKVSVKVNGKEIINTEVRKSKH